MKILNGRTPQDAIASLASVLSVKPEILVKFFKSYRKGVADNLIETSISLHALSEAIEQLIGKNLESLFPVSVYIFHATRLDVDTNTIMTEGLLPRRAMEGKILQKIEQIANEASLENDGTSQGDYEESFQAKQNGYDEGPFGSLIWQIAYSPQSSKCYHACPELVEDMAGLCLGKQAEPAVQILKDHTLPAIVTFRASEEIGVEHLIDFSLYCFLVANDLSDEDASLACEHQMSRKFVNMNGKTVLPEDIQSIEWLPVERGTQPDKEPGPSLEHQISVNFR